MKKTFFFAGVALGVAFSAGWLLSPTKVEIENSYSVSISDGTEQLRELILEMDKDSLGRDIPQEITVLCNNLYLLNPNKETIRDWVAMPEFKSFIGEYYDFFCGFEFLAGDSSLYNKFLAEYYSVLDENNL